MQSEQITYFTIMNFDKLLNNILMLFELMGLMLEQIMMIKHEFR